MVLKLIDFLEVSVPKIASKSVADIFSHTVSQTCNEVGTLQGSLCPCMKLRSYVFRIL
jgi:hypothetical protein